MKTLDAKPLSKKQLRAIARKRFARSRRIESFYMRQLAILGDNIGLIIKSQAPGGVVSVDRLRSMLEKYANTLDPWAEAVASTMLDELAARDALAWFQAADEIGLHLRHELKEAPVGQAIRELMKRQVHLIRSLPIEAANRVHKLVQINMAESHRAEEIAQRILNSGQVTVARARLIARTEVARSQSSLTEVRAKHVGSKGYIWRTAGDEDVRPALHLPPRVRARFVGSHRKLEGKYFSWDDPPVSGQRGERAHPGCIYNCRCFAEPVLPDVV